LPINDLDKKESSNINGEGNPFFSTCKGTLKQREGKGKIVLSLELACDGLLILANIPGQRNSMLYFEAQLRGQYLKTVRLSNQNQPFIKLRQNVLPRWGKKLIGVLFYRPITPTGWSILRVNGFAF
jgi:hypothetical protein